MQKLMNAVFSCENSNIFYACVGGKIVVLNWH